jgi:protease I
MKTIAILVEDKYQVLEVWYPYLRLKEAGFNPVLVGPGVNSVYQSKEGYPATPEISIKDLSVDDVDGVVVPGGYAPDRLRRYDTVNTFVNKVFNQGKLTAAICHGGWVLVSAGILKARKATCFFAIKDDIINAGAHYTDEEVVCDRNLITSRKPEDLPAFMNAIINFLGRNR